ncbi:N-acetylglucosamine-6-phosphate deacetylase [Pararcticibacter amylolyticus]|uniref:N-acetylglucosamine-6-phosphate deacetylase n=1 Tax=Pararcticibacter amylolyticus TaxID=2173175 RepID=A0A2U2PL01_9SPHI|nr:N-acetylglucosamine-6-phosphate deacetylase [Pararcticibacter amylolyticus]PWG81954.1 N-acetylglucosamine-6-phosphate deacetylase [Pararcticibacter amylolyticus]
MSLIKIYNGTVITPYRTIREGTILLRDGKILEVTDKNVEAEGATAINARGMYISPGFIDIHVHGGGGHDFMDNTVEAFLGIARAHARYGTTSLMPTTLSCEKEDLLKTLSVYEEANVLNKAGAGFIGIHIEGPYFSMNQKGAQDPRYIRYPDPEEYREIIAYSASVKRWSAAPELPGALPFGEFLRSKGILPAIAHTDAIYEEVLEAYEKGFVHATHFYSCMSGVSRRNAYRFAGVVESAYLLDGMTVEIIADGVHLPASLLKLVYKIKGADRIALITDAMRGAGMPPGKSILGSLKDGVEVIVEDGVAKLPDRSAFAGSVATGDILVRNMVRLADVPLADAIKMSSETPASIMGIADKKGSLVKGKDADVIIFDEDIRIDTTIVNGEIVYPASELTISN